MQKVKGTQAQKLKPKVCAVASQRLALRGEHQKSGRAHARIDVGVCASPLCCIVSLNLSQHYYYLRSRAYV